MHTRFAVSGATASQKHIKDEIRLWDVTDIPIFRPQVTFGIMILCLTDEAQLW